jgi:hypothetical protein
MSEFKFKINFVVFSTDIKNGKQFVLSLDKDNLKLPHVDLKKEWIKNIDLNIAGYLKNNVIQASDYDLIPQLICLHSNEIAKDTNEINCVYGFIVTHTDKLINTYWQTFTISSEQKYLSLLLESIQKLR